MTASGDDEQTENKTRKTNSQTDLRQRSQSQTDFRQTPAKEITAKPERILTGTKRKALNNTRSGKQIHKEEKN